MGRRAARRHGADLRAHGSTARAGIATMLKAPRAASRLRCLSSPAAGIPRFRARLVTAPWPAGSRYGCVDDVSLTLPRVSRDAIKIYHRRCVRIGRPASTTIQHGAGACQYLGLILSARASGAFFTPRSFSSLAPHAMLSLLDFDGARFSPSTARLTFRESPHGITIYSRRHFEDTEYSGFFRFAI